MCEISLHAFLCTMWPQKTEKEVGTLDLELHIAVSYHVDAGNEPAYFW